MLSISGNNASRVFYLGSGMASLSGLKVTGGNSYGGRAAAFTTGGTLTLTNSTVSGNSASFAAAACTTAARSRSPTAPSG